MERLTKWMPGGYGLTDGYKINDLRSMRVVVDRLAAYEETGLEPEEIKEAYQKGWQKAIDEIAYEEQAGTILVENPLLAEYIELGPVDRLRKLAQADRLLGKDIRLGKESISGEVTEIAINSDGIFAYVRSGGGGFYIKPIDVLEESNNGKERLP